MDWATITSVLYLVSWCLFVIALFVVPRNRNPGSAIAWLLLIFLLPLLGFLFYLVFGNPKLSRPRRAMQRTMSETLANVTDSLKQHSETASEAALLDPP